MASNAGWNKSIPSGLSPIAQGDDEIRSFKSFMQAWWEQEHYGTDGSASSAGVHKEGSARASSSTTPPTVAAPKGQLWHDPSTDEFFVHDGTSWVTISSNVRLSSVQTWTALQKFNAGVQASDLSISDVFSGWTSYSTFTDVASIATGTVRAWIATDGVAANAALGDMCMIHASDVDTSVIYSARASNGSISLGLWNAGTIAVNPSAQTYTVFLFKRGHL